MTEKTDRSFSNGEPVDSIETEKSRIVLRELERGWWILAVSGTLSLGKDRTNSKSVCRPYPTAINIHAKRGSLEERI